MASIQSLRHLLENLPKTLPEPPLSSYDFTVDPQFLADEGLEAAINRQLEIAIGHRAHNPKLRERGHGILAIIPVFEQAVAANFGQVPGLVQLWIDYLTQMATDASADGGKCSAPNVLEVSSSDDEAPARKRAKKASDQLTLSFSSSKGKVKSKHKKAKPKAYSANTSIVVDVDSTEYPDPILADSDEDEVDPKKGGATPDLLVRLLTRPCRNPNQPDKKRVRCLGSAFCKTSWCWPRNLARIQNHLQRCPHLPSDHQRAVAEAFAEKAPAAKIKQREEAKCHLDATTTGPCPTPSGTSNTGAAALYKAAASKGLEALTDVTDNNIVQFVCAAGLAPNVLNLREWKALLTGLNNRYVPKSASTFEKSLIPQTASWVRQEQERFLATCRNLSLSTDGMRNRKKQPIYTVSITTPDRRVFLVHGDENARLTHDGVYISNVLKKIIARIGSHTFGSVAADNTGNTTRARRLVKEIYPHILDLPDPVHRQNLWIKDIAKLPIFEDAIQYMRGTIKHFQQATHDVIMLNDAREPLGITRTLESIGNTRFATLYRCAVRLRDCLPALYVLYDDGLRIEGLSHLFIRNSSAAITFQLDLTRLITVLEPIAKSLKCLESTHSTLADVYVYWLAASAELQQIFTSPDRGGFDRETVENIIGICNFRFNQMINDAPEDAYITAFVLDPRYRAAAVLGQLNPLAPTIRIPAAGATTASAVRTKKRVGQYLLKMLDAEYKLGDKRHPSLLDISPADAVDHANAQINLYFHKKYPFHRTLKAPYSALNWWTDLQRDESATVLATLAIKLYSICPNSMADERVGSRFTFLNRALRNRQDAHTMVDQTQIYQYHHNDPAKMPPKSRPTVKFRDLDAAIFGKAPLIDDAPPPSSPGEPKSSHPEKSRDDDCVRVASGDDEGDDWLDEPAEFIAPAAVFELDERAVSLDSPFLLDILSDRPISASHEQPEEVSSGGKSVKGKERAAVFEFCLDP